MDHLAAIAEDAMSRRTWTIGVAGVLLLTGALDEGGVVVRNDLGTQPE